MTRTSDSFGSSPSFFLSKSDVRGAAPNAICLPFGDQAIDSTAFGIDVIACGSPPPIESKKICAGCGLLSLSIERMNASVFPSGDQRGDESRGPFVSCRSGDPLFVADDQIEVRYFSPLSSTVTRTNATCEPSGESSGSPIQLKRSRSFSVMGRFANAVNANNSERRTIAFFIAQYQ